MIPLKLAVENYRSHARAEIDFSALAGGAAITGPTGVGKTSLLEAMLWCLYGQSRNGRTHDAVIRIGAEQCVVTVEVRVAAQVWRVTRKRSSRSGGKSEFDLWRWDGSDWVPCSGKAIDRGEDSTQARIHAALGITLETLIHGPVALQGDANRFAGERPEGRREVLRQILGLDRYRELSLEAKRAGDREQAEADALRRTADDMAGPIPLDEQLADARAAARESGDKLHAHSSAVTSLSEQATAAQRAEAVATAASDLRSKQREAIPRLRATLTAHQRHAVELRRQQADAEALADSAHVAAVEGAVARLPDAEREEVELAEALAEARGDAARLAELLSQREALAQRWRAAEARRQAAAENARSVADVERIAAEVPALTLELERASAVLQACIAAEAEVEPGRPDAPPLEDVDPDLREAVDAHNAAIAARDAIGPLDALEAAMGDANAAEFNARTAWHDASREAAAAAEALRVAESAALQMYAAPCSASTGWLATPVGAVVVREACDLAATCPLLRSARGAFDRLPTAQQRVDDAELAVAETASANVSAEAALRVAADAVEAAKRARDAVRATEHRLSAARTRAENRARAAWRARRTESEAAARVHGALQSRMVEASQAAFRLDAARDAAAREAAAQDEVNAIVAEGAAVKGRIDELQAKRSSADVEAALTRAREALVGLRALAGQVEAVRGATRAVEAARAALARAEDDASAVVQQLDELERDDTSAALVAAHHDRVRVELALADARGALDRARAASERARDEVQRLEGVEQRVTALRGQAEQQAAAAALSRAAAEALAIAAIIQIEAAIPVIEREANRVLATVSTRGMRLSLETQRTKGDGAQAESLDITVRDARGERPYESFSGGEQFTISMALRLGLARLLADRDGVPIEFLVIDEGGFGALSPDYISTMRDVVAALQTQFKLVLVVTHLEDVADVLPCRIAVSDGPSGSVVAIEGNV